MMVVIDRNFDRTIEISSRSRSRSRGETLANRPADRDAGGARGADARDSPSFRRPILYSRNKISTTLSGSLYARVAARKLVPGAGQSEPVWASRSSHSKASSAIPLDPDRPRAANAAKAGSKLGLQARPSSYPGRFVSRVYLVAKAPRAQ